MEHAIPPFCLSLSISVALLYFPLSQRAREHVVCLFGFLAVVGSKWMFPAAFVSLTGSYTKEGGSYCYIRYTAAPVMNHNNLRGRLGWSLQLRKAI